MAAPGRVQPGKSAGKDAEDLTGAATDKKVIARLSETLSAGGRFEGKAINYKKNGTPFSDALARRAGKAGQKYEGLARDPA